MYWESFAYIAKSLQSNNSDDEMSEHYKSMLRIL